MHYPETYNGIGNSYGYYKVMPKRRNNEQATNICKTQR